MLLNSQNILKSARFTNLRDELAEEKELNKKLLSTLLSLQDKYLEVCQELRNKIKNENISSLRGESSSNN